MNEITGSIHAASHSAELLVRGDRPLYTATLRMTGRDGSCLEFFHACRTGTIAEAIARLGARVGAGMAAAANVRPGVDVRDPIVVALLGTVLAARLAEDGDLGGSALLHSGDLHIVQRRG